jgi:hypothetical protein
MRSFQLKWHDVVPVVISVLVIILVAVLQKQSKVVAAITATMPLNIPLALWIVYSSSRGEKTAVEGFSRSMALGIIPTVGFTVAAWLGARAGWKLLPIFGLSYTTWGVTTLLLLLLRRWVGI